MDTIFSFAHGGAVAIVGLLIGCVLVLAFKRIELLRGTRPDDVVEAGLQVGGAILMAGALIALVLLVT